MRRLTHHGSRWLEPARREPQPSVVTTDGGEIDCWHLPATPRPGTEGALVLHVHGGPRLSHGPTPWLEMLALAHAGIGVLWANPRGSASYGRPFERVVDGDWGGADADDLVAVVRWAIERGLATPGQIGVTGYSYGGFMTLWLLATRQDVFAAGVSENPVSNYISMATEWESSPQVAERHLGLGPLEPNLDRYLERSPISRLSELRGPLLLLQAEDDTICPRGQSEQVYALLRSRGRPVELVLYPDERHDIALRGRPDRRADRIDRIVGWFERTLSAPNGAAESLV